MTLLTFPPPPSKKEYILPLHTPLVSGGGANRSIKAFHFVFKKIIYAKSRVCWVLSSISSLCRKHVHTCMYAYVSKIGRINIYFIHRAFLSRARVRVLIYRKFNIQKQYITSLTSAISSLLTGTQIKWKKAETLHIIKSQKLNYNIIHYMLYKNHK